MLASLTVPAVTTVVGIVTLAASLVHPYTAAHSINAAETGPQIVSTTNAQAVPLEPAVPPTIAITLWDLNGLRKLSVPIRLDGKVSEATAERLREFLRCRRTHRSRRMHPGLLAMVADLGQHYGGRVIEIMSGYRPPPYGAPRSKHFIGRALDLRVRGVKLTALRDYLWKRYAGKGVGVGWYPGSGFIHMDHRPGQRDTAWTQRHKWARYRYWPYWSRR